MRVYVLTNNEENTFDLYGVFSTYQKARSARRKIAYKIARQFLESEHREEHGYSPEFAARDIYNMINYDYQISEVKIDQDINMPL